MASKKIQSLVKKLQAAVEVEAKASKSAKTASKKPGISGADKAILAALNADPILKKNVKFLIKTSREALKPSKETKS